MKTVFKKGMTVYWGELKGEVLEVLDETYSYPVTVIFTKEFKDFFTMDGRINENSPQLLSLTPYTLNGFSQEPQIEKDTLVYVRDKENSHWLMRFYSHFENGIHYCFNHQKNQTETENTTSWKFVETENPLLK